MTEPNITVLLVDDHSLVRRGFRRMLEDDPSIRVVGEAEDGHQAVQLAAELKPQVVVMDFAMPSMNGAVAARHILRAAPETAILILSMHAEASYVRTCLEAGVRGYLLKNALEASPAGTTVSVRILCPLHDSQFYIQVQDHGKGIDPAHVNGW